MKYNEVSSLDKSPGVPQITTILNLHKFNYFFIVHDLNQFFLYLDNQIKILQLSEEASPKFTSILGQVIKSL